MMLQLRTRHIITDIDIAFRHSLRQFQVIRHSPQLFTCHLNVTSRL
jgi:hypothetical protein